MTSFLHQTGVFSMVCAVAMAGALAACGDDSTTGGGGSGGGSGGEGGAPASNFESSECGLCATDACADEIAACQSDPGCTSYLDCLLSCPVAEAGNADGVCEEGCAADASSETAQLRAELTACRYYGAGADCAACAIPTDPQNENLNQMCEPRPDPPTACRACYWEHCCDTWDACFADGVNPDCDDLATCIQACTDPFAPCIDACFADHPDSVETLLAQVGCSVSECAADQTDCDHDLRDECEVCIFETCGDPFTDLISTGDGYLLWNCMADCGSGDEGVPCIEACFDEYPDAEEAGFLWAECLDYSCETLC